ncbi:MLO-like protein 14 isoform X5 [Durio zibethinus]|uniref:MLO-like protein n=1 Tax=Durio zibethinus TaxID=66656 RepID=A0A6P5ZLP9_DURZI|nr:MLO-like protein 14 isoform X5 [Durio zibethinus]
MVESVENDKEMRSLALTPTWSVATVLTIFVAVSLIVERSIHRLSNWLRKTNRKPLLAAVEKMKEELMLLGFISLLLTATSSTIANICIESKFYDSTFAPCTRSEIDEDLEDNSSKERKLLTVSSFHLFRRMLNGVNRNTCKEGHEPFVSYEGLEQLHRFIFVMAITHVSYSCLTMLLAIVKIHSWRAWEDEAHKDQDDLLNEKARVSIMRRQATFVIMHTSNPLTKNSLLIWVVGSNLYFWIAIIPITLVLLVGAKLQHVIATLALENAGITGYFTGAKLRPRDELFWFKKPEWLLSLIHFILFQNAFELASFFWFWWQFGYNSCFIRNHTLVYIRLILGFAGQFICSYITLPLYALVTQMGTNYKAALIPQQIRETIHGWGKAARRKRRHGRFTDDSTIHTETSTVMSLEEDDHQLIDVHEDGNGTYTEIELQPPPNVTSSPSPVANETSSRVGTPLLRPSASISASTIYSFEKDDLQRSSSMPARRERHKSTAVV